ncbi:glycosyltransferase family 2 protein [Algicola sagamiensis]|uniref:glycosyltransferase family 2 protein n=1 Tax=Algicola sagamiensis TaxID=163869 RepID=UPI00036FD00D|nr:glycosyltransferase family 2 protein [Algicola sagamiensis]
MLFSIIVPIFNEEETIALFYRAVRGDLFLKQHDVEIVFINDGSSDASEDIVRSIAQEDSLVKLISLSRNFGKEPALFCGLEYSQGDVVIPMDVDLQDPVELIQPMYEMWQKGAKVVLAKRSCRKSDHVLKRLTARWFYKIHNLLSHSKIEDDVGDFRLLDRDVVNVIISLNEKNLFMKGLLSWPGFKTDVVEYVRPERHAGTTKFNGIQLFRLAIEGITNFSTAPLKLASYIGFIVSILSGFYGLVIIAKTIFLGVDVKGYASLMTAMLFLGGIQLIAIGILGEYVGRIYSEVKSRPRYVIESLLGCDEKKPD